MAQPSPTPSGKQLQHPLSTSKPLTLAIQLQYSHVHSSPINPNPPNHEQLVATKISNKSSKTNKKPLLHKQLKQPTPTQMATRKPPSRGDQEGHYVWKGYSGATLMLLQVYCHRRNIARSLDWEGNIPTRKPS